MKDQIRAYLKDIADAIHEIKEFIPTEKNFEIFNNDLKTKRAVERNIEIIGEALNRILKIDSEIFISDFRRIVDTRNRIIHGYDKVSSEILWAIVIKNLPVLEREIKNLLDI